MLAAPVARVMEQRRRRCRATEQPVIVDIGPDAADVGLDLGEHRHRSIVTVQPVSCEDMRLDQPVQRHQRGGAGTDLVGKRRQTEPDLIRQLVTQQAPTEPASTTPFGERLRERRATLNNYLIKLMNLGGAGETAIQPSLGRKPLIHM